MLAVIANFSGPQRQTFFYVIRSPGSYSGLKTHEKCGKTPSRMLFLSSCSNMAAQHGRLHESGPALPVDIFFQGNENTVLIFQ